MDSGIQFFPDVGPGEKTGEDYWQEALELVAICDELGYTHVRTVEHYFNPYGGYSSNPIVFLTAAAMRSKKTRLITGAVLPVFNHPLKLAGEIGMLDAIVRQARGRVRARVPAPEFARFGAQSTRAASASRRGWSRCAACSRRKMLRSKASSTASRM